MMELLGPKDWKEFLQAPIAVLIIGKNGCHACETWTEELQTFEIPSGVRIGKILLDTPELGRFKINQPWVAEIDVLPFNAIYVNGELKKQWAGGGINRLSNRLNRFI